MRSAICAISRRASLPRESSVKRLVSATSSPPGAQQRETLDEEVIVDRVAALVVDGVVQRDVAEGDVADHQLEAPAGEVNVGEAGGVNGRGWGEASGRPRR